MAFLSSNKIKVFPTAFRGQDSEGHAIDPGSFLTTEENFVNIANKVTYLHKNYFYVDGNIAYIILGGYYFVANVSDIQALFTNPANGDEIWAGINVADFGSAYESTSVKTLTPNGGSAGETLDDSTNFKGLTFLGKNDSKDGFTYKLKLFKRVSNAWVIEESSQLNISTNQIENGNSSTPITKSFSTNALSASSISASFIATNELVAYSYGITTQSIFGPSQLVIGTSGTLSLYASSIYTQGDILPYASEIYNLGSIWSGFQSLYIKDILNSGDMSIIADSGIVGGGYTGVLNLRAGSYISLNGTTNTHSIYPNASNTYTLGNSSKYYKSAYITNAYLSSIYGSGADNSLLLSAGNTNLSTRGFTVDATGIRLQAGNLSGSSIWFTMDSSACKILMNASIVSFYMRTSGIALGLDTVGSPSMPIYLSAGKIVAANGIYSGSISSDTSISDDYLYISSTAGNYSTSYTKISNTCSIECDYVNIGKVAKFNFNISASNGFGFQSQDSNGWLRFSITDFIKNQSVTSPFKNRTIESISFVVTNKRTTINNFQARLVGYNDNSYLYIGFDTDGNSTNGVYIEATVRFLN